MSLKNHSRRKFLQLAATGAGLSFVFLWDKMMDTRLMTSMNKKVVLPLRRRLVTFYGEFIVIHKKKQVTVLSAHCTHLGCLINKVENGKLVCPCHGSEFDLRGNATKGPAYKPLKSYPFEKSDSEQQVTIQPSDA